MDFITIRGDGKDVRYHGSLPSIGETLTIDGDHYQVDAIHRTIEPYQHTPTVYHTTAITVECSVVMWRT